ncbi:Hsp70 family protein [Methylicorpusculum sp.]|uniref:Hsp70 family protein n=1 Tax=Methylicorpusculum sp. TaxID=2713644 RepID=UPI00272FC7AE|nr:Hsp70 family protein [Methylicorpusculum sp.]MDP2179802.1 Hsp70 family protein [Methylicorpusculum sp.]MDP3528489.1 Hsp70 family protein [Methylicorpusculum sp.]MDZ4152094.1 Hsp70 family protein [Methylicorpusculum sp.]
MVQKNPQFLIGIDLGTTHTVVAYTPADQLGAEIKIFLIEQLVAPGEVAARPLLPSVRYHPAEGELSDADLAFLPTQDKSVMGEAARVLGAKTQGRFVTSAKSWLSHPSVDHTADILPWGSSEDVVKVSPLAASAGYLDHIRMVWRHQFPNAPLEEQDIVITVPASFDEGARSLTVEAAKIAGLNRVKLLEEPQAVCYDWLQRHAGSINQQLADVRLLLVCDVGGGTTDLTLIKVEPGVPEPKLTRIGVGEHLMLGGDNIDLALAHLAEQRLISETKRLSAADLSQLIEQCRIVKEKLLAQDAPEQLSVTLLGGGSRLIGSARSVVLTRDEVRSIALDGFFPLSQLNELPDRKRSGVVEFGLPYAAEPAISKHIAAFLKLHSQAALDAMQGEGKVPDALLLNGGVFRSEPITRRVQDLLTAWRGKAPKLLDNRHPELAVAIGAVSYALARRNKQVRIGGGAARSYFLAVDTDGDCQQGVCILPRGCEEGHEIVLQDRQFGLRLGQPVRFHLVSTTGDAEFKPGEIATITDDRFQTLPPLAVALAATEHSSSEQEIVKLAVTLTEIGTLKIQCVSVKDSNQRWDVEFQIRRKNNLSTADQAILPPQFNKAIELVQTVFGSRSKDVNPKAVKSLRADLEKLLGSARSEWETPLLRGLFAALLYGMKYRKRSENHERVWLSLTGYCLRPGLGYPLDDWRVDQLWKIYDQGIQFVNETQNWSEWWTLWRRVAGGLNVAAQERISDDIGKFLNPASARQPAVARQMKTRSYDDMVRLAAVLEKLPVPKKIQLGEWLLNRLSKPGESEQSWWALGRIGARMPFYGSSHAIIAPKLASEWLQQVMQADWKKIPQAGFAATLIARMSGDRTRDIDENLRIDIIEQLKQAKAPASWIEMVETHKQLDEKEEKQIFGEALPPGLKLIQ